MSAIAVIGAGLAGLACASELRRSGHVVTVLDKGRGPGGRTSTRRDGTWRFDHGAPRLELGAPELTALRASWEAAGVIVPWRPRIAGTDATHRQTWIGVPGASALAAHLARDLDVRVGAKVTALVDRGRSWSLRLDTGDTVGPFDEVVLTAPAPQTRDLLASARAHALVDATAAAHFAPCLAAMVRVRPTRDHALDELRLTDGPLASAHRMDTRPGRDANEGVQAWVLHGSEPWSIEHLERDPSVSAAELVHAFMPLVPGPIVHVQGHRWRYARAVKRVPASHLRDAARGLTLAGDWFEAGGDVPAASRAVLSGLAAADALRSHG